MLERLSNALCTLASGQGGQEYGLPAPLLIPMAAGILLSVAWLIQRITYPHKASLTDSPGRINTVHPLLILTLFVIHQLVVGIISQAWNEWFQANQALVLTACVAHMLLLVLCLLVASRTFRHGLWRGFGLTGRRWRWDLLRAFGAILIALPLCVLLQQGTLYLIREVFSSRPDLVKELTQGHGLLDALSELGWPWAIGVFASAVVLAPIAEEMLFRGLLQSCLRQLSHRPWVAILATSLLFALAHGQPANQPALFALAVILGYNYERTGRLLPAIAIHALFNLTFVLLRLWQDAQPPV